MLAIRRIIDDPQAVIPVPPEFRHRRIEVIFIALDQESEAAATVPDTLDPIRRFRGKGRGGSVADLLKDREQDRAPSFTRNEV
ncbi:hypothetical protein JCM19379_25440 [Methyloparacoccus murrellii]